ncbi:hypothetical protein N9X53_04780 [Mariniblastus sp.]|nr:hypothetical protein [Mariniblastus sp.]MDB4371437.1 hypothetical protein [Mariniblastus sp.]
MTLLQPNSKTQIEQGCPWPTEWQFVSHGGLDYAIGVEDRSMWSPSRHSLFVYAKQPKSNEWFLQLSVPDVIGGGPIRMELNAKSGIMTFLQVTGALPEHLDRTIATFDTASVSPYSAN